MASGQLYTLKCQVALSWDGDGGVTVELLAFQGLVAAHIVAGSIGAVSFWVPVAGRKGGVQHRRWGRVFTVALLVTGSLAVAMSVFSLIDPVGTHPHLAGQFGAPFIRGIFGWMMLHVGILTLNLTWYGWLCVRNRGDVAANRTLLNLGLQYAVIAAALNCAWQGWLIGQPLMMAIAVVGVADALKGQVAMAFVVPKAGDAVTDSDVALKLEGEIMKRVADELGALARPARVRFVTGLPKTRSGKLLRRAIQAVCEGRDPGDLTTIDDPVTLQKIGQLVVP